MHSGVGESMCRGWAGALWDPTGGAACSGLCGKSFYLSERGCERYISSGCMAGETQGYPVPVFFVLCPIDLDSKLSSPQGWEPRP